MTSALPIIDLKALSEGDETALARIAAEAGAACRDVGFFYAVGHGVDSRLISDAFAQSRRFFAFALAD